MEVVKLTEKNFEKEVLKAKETVIVDFYADWCGPCKMQSPILDEIAEERANVKVCKINVDEEPEIEVVTTDNEVTEEDVLSGAEEVEVADAPEAVEEATEEAAE